MTTRSGDALSHVNFQARWASFLTAIGLPRISASTLRLIVVNWARARSTRFCIAGMSGHARNEIGRPPSFEHYLHKSLLNV
jgi:hypothetical protein